MKHFLTRSIEYTNLDPYYTPKNILKMTAVEWLKNNIPSLFIDDTGHYKELFQQALIMEKEQIIDALFFGIHLNHKINSPLKRAEQYYNETFSNKGD